MSVFRVTAGRVLQAFACLAIALAATATLTTSADAKPTGWMSKGEMGSSVANEPWRGYGETGYVGPERKARKSARFSKSVRAEGYYAPKASKKYKSARYAALKDGLTDAAPRAKSLTGGGVRWAASSSCLNGSLVAAVHHVASNYGSVTVNSTCRSRKHNAAVGGAHRSQHLTGNAVDLRVHGNWRAAKTYLSSLGGGYKHYGGGLFHIDTGPRRSW